MYNSQQNAQLSIIVVGAVTFCIGTFIRWYVCLFIAGCIRWMCAMCMYSVAFDCRVCVNTCVHTPKHIHVHISSLAKCTTPRPSIIYLICTKFFYFIGAVEQEPIACSTIRVEYVEKRHFNSPISIYRLVEMEISTIIHTNNIRK